MNSNIFVTSSKEEYWSQSIDTKAKIITVSEFLGTTTIPATEFAYPN